MSVVDKIVKTLISTAEAQRKRHGHGFTLIFYVYTDRNFICENHSFLWESVSKGFKYFGTRFL